jgi:hypothetical protein
MALPEHPATSKITIARLLRCMGAGYLIPERAAFLAARPMASVRGSFDFGWAR